MAEKKFHFNPEWDLVDATAEEAAEFEGGKLYKQNTVHLAVLSGTYYEMGRQYGHLLKDQILWHAEELKKEFIEKPSGLNPKDKPLGLMTYDEMKEVAIPGFYVGKPRHHKQMIKGAAETSGMSVDDLAIMDEMIMVVLYGRSVNMCTSCVVFGSSSKDGNVYTGRCHDFSQTWRDRLAKVGVFVVLNPTGSDISVGFPARAGQMTSPIDAINSKGLYLQFNNAGNLRPYLYTNMRSISNTLMMLAESYTTVDELDVVVPYINANNAFNMMAADPTRARYFEVNYYKSVMTEPEAGNGDMSCRANLALSPAWDMAQNYPERTMGYSPTRRSNWIKYMSEDPKTNDDAKMRAYLSKSIFENGEVSDGSALIAENNLGFDDWTAYQVVTRVKDRKLWWRIPTQSPWMEFDLKRYFTNS